MLGQDFADATNKMTIECEMTPREELLELCDDVIQPTHQRWNFANCTHMNPMLFTVTGPD